MSGVESVACIDAQEIAEGERNVLFVAATGFLFCAFVEQIGGAVAKANIIAELCPDGVTPLAFDLVAVGFQGVLPQAGEVRYRVHEGVDGFHAAGALGDLVDDAVMEADFQAPHGFVRVVAGVGEGIFVDGTFPDGFHEGAFVADVDFFGFVVEADLQAVGFAEGVGFTSAIDGGAVEAFEYQVTEAVVDGDGFGSCDEVLGEVLGRFPALEVDGQV